MLTQILGLLAMEFQLLWSDRRSRLALIVPSLLQLIVFGYAATFDVSRAQIAVLNEDIGPYGRELAARFAGSPSFDITALPTSEREIATLIDSAEVMAAIHIGQRFSAQLRGSGVPTVQVVLDGRHLPTALTVQSYVTAIVRQFDDDYAAENGLIRPAAATVTRAWFNPNLESHWFIIPGLVAKLVLIATLVATVSIAREREFGRFDRMFALGLSPLPILLAKLAPPLAVGFLQGLTMSAIAALWFQTPFRGSPALLALSFLMFALATAGIGILLSSHARTQRQATLRIFLFLVPAVLLSGFATPIAAMPEWIQVITYLNPLRYGIVILRALFLRDVGFEFFWAQLLPLALIALASLGASYFLIRPLQS